MTNNNDDDDDDILSVCSPVLTIAVVPVLFEGFLLELIKFQEGLQGSH